jgi:hypothetical protein
MAHDYDTTGQYEMPDEPGQESEKVVEIPKPEEKPAEQPEQELKPAAEEKQRDEKGRFVPKEGEKPPEAQAETKPDSEYAKAQKEQARIGKKLKEFEAEKQATRAEAARLQQERAQFELERQAEQARNLPRAQKDGFTAPDYYKASQDFFKEGDYENAYKAMATANELVAYEQQYYQQTAQQQQQAVVMNQFQADLQQVIQHDPEAEWKQNMPEESQTPLARAVNQVLNERPYLVYFPGGARGAYELARLRMEHFELIEAKAELERRKNEDTAREKASQPLRGGPTKPGQPVKLEDLSEEEGEAELLRMAERLDAGYGP